ncbi:transporter [Sporanaerobium hydrogeniformans]|uniref:Transporter n=1 Tax=Sporanaerobium hydrogeniformans TaxID=3072179 RepID=A0AC61DAY2_9FIRM|nr:transporter [Sporanaerobium hydrogeniformans]PHV70203.1 transporter [Sporanaerobium hydrogeniformans]
MKSFVLKMQIATIFVGSIVGAGVCSGRELNQFFATYGIGGFLGLFLCGILYVLLGKIIVVITEENDVGSYDEFVNLVCPKYVAKFINSVLTLFLLSSTSIILAGSGTILNQYFGLPKWIGFSLMVGCSSLFLLRNTEGLFEVNSIVVPTLFIMMSALFIGYIKLHPEELSYGYLQFLPRQKQHLFTSTFIYVSFNILTIIGVIVPLTRELKRPKEIVSGIVWGSIILTLISSFIVFLMMVSPFHAKRYEVPLLGVAQGINHFLQLGILGVMWLEMFSSQVSNVYSLCYFMQNQFKLDYKMGIFLVVAVAAPFSIIGFSKLVEFLYPMYGVLSLVFLIYCILFYFRSRG